MALRQIDNELPITPERPKKQVKVSALPIQKKQSEFGLTDENKAPLPTSADATIDYISSKNLTPIQEDPESKLQGLIEGLDSKDWTRVCESLNDVRRFALFHSSLLQPILEKVLVVMVKAIKNPRSALCKTSIMASSDIFTAFADALLAFTTNDAFDNLLMQLLLKASQDKRFVCEEADKALDALVKAITPLPLLSMLRVYVNHANLRVRAKAAISISSCVSKMGLEEMQEFGFITLLQMAVDLLNDRLPEAREAARNVVISMYEAYTANEEQKQEVWEKFCQLNLSPTHAQSAVKVACPK